MPAKTRMQGNRPSKSDARRQAAERQARNRRLTFIGLCVLAVAALVGVVVQSHRSQQTNIVKSAAATGPDGSHVIGTGPVLVEEYGDFQCPHCGLYEQTTYPTIRQLVDQGKIRFAFHAFTFIGTESFDLANAAYCAGDIGKFWPVHDYFYAHQQKENSGFWTTDQLISALQANGASTPQTDQCVRNHTYNSWLHVLTDLGSQRGVAFTPSIYVNGVPPKDELPATLTAAVAAASGR